MELQPIEQSSSHHMSEELIPIHNNYIASHDLHERREVF